jgi:threonyl-tRNA synthetase
LRAPIGAATQTKPQLQRIYGTAWAGPRKDLEDYISLRLEEAEKRDHRKLGREMDLFHFQEEGRAWCSGTRRAGCCSARSIAYMRRRLDAAGYVEVNAPQVLDRSFWEKSGHWDKYRENMFVCESAR